MCKQYYRLLKVFPRRSYMRHYCEIFTLVKTECPESVLECVRQEYQGQPKSTPLIGENNLGEFWHFFPSFADAVL